MCPSGEEFFTSEFSWRLVDMLPKNNTRDHRLAEECLCVYGAWNLSFLPGLSLIFLSLGLRNLSFNLWIMQITTYSTKTKRFEIENKCFFLAFSLHFGLSGLSWLGLFLILELWKKHWLHWIQFNSSVIKVSLNYSNGNNFWHLRWYCEYIVHAASVNKGSAVDSYPL